MTFLGHAGMYVETEGGTRALRPVVHARLLRVVVPVPAQRRARPGRVLVARTTSTSRTCTTTTSTRRGSPSTSTRAATVLLPGVRARPPRAGAARPRLHASSSTPSTPSRSQLGALEVAILAMTAPADGPAGDSALVLARLDRPAPEPERRPAPRPPRARGARPVRRALHPVLRRDLVPDGLRLPARREAPRSASASGPTRWSGRCTTCATSHAPHVFPVAGSAVLPRRRPVRVQRPRRRPGQHLPGPDRVPRRARSGAGSPAASCSCPGRVATLVDGGCTVEQPAGRRVAGRDLRRQARRDRAVPRRLARRGSSAERASWPRASRSTSSRALREWWEPLLDVAPLTRAGVGGAVLLHLGDVGVLIDFPAGTVREWAGEPVVYRIDTDRALVESCIERHVEDWVNELFLSCRFRAHRDGSVQRVRLHVLQVPLARADGVLRGPLREPGPSRSDEMFRCGDYLVQKRCPHLRADLERFGDGRGRRARVHGAPLAVRPRDRALPHVGRRRAPAAHDPDRPSTGSPPRCSSISTRTPRRARTARARRSRSWSRPRAAHGLDALCITEHDVRWPGDELADASRLLDFPLIPGVELTTDVGHVLVFGPLAEAAVARVQARRSWSRSASTPTPRSCSRTRCAGSRGSGRSRVGGRHRCRRTSPRSRSGRRCTRSRWRARRPRRSSTRSPRPRSR